MVVTNMFGKNIATMKVNQSNGNVLPSSTRRFEESLNKKRLFGKYTAAINLAYGTQGQLLMGSTTFWVIPYKIVAAAILALIILILLLLLVIKRYNRWIINRSGGNKSSTPTKRQSPPQQRANSVLPSQEKPQQHQPTRRPPRPPLIQW